MRLVRDRINNNIQEKLCMKCNSFKSVSEFHKGGKGKFGVISTCKECSCKLRRNRYLKNKDRLLDLSKKYRENDKDRARNFQLQYYYGITLNEYNQMLINQDYKCFICKRPENELKRGLMVDHNHKTNKVRKLLCDRCNTGLGKFIDNSELLRLAANYLDEH